MAKQCLKCQRPNSDAATRCMYCGSDLPVAPVSARQKKEAPSAQTREKKAESYLTMISPSQKILEDKTSALMKILMLDAYTARQKLKTPAPWVGKSFADPVPAQNMVQNLNSIGVDSYLVKQSGIDRISSRIAVTGLSDLGEEQAVFTDGAGKKTPLFYKDIFIIVCGSIKEQAEREDSIEDETSPVNIGKMIVNNEDGAEKNAFLETIGSISVKPRRSRVRMVLSSQRIEIMDIYRHNSPQSVRVVESEFDYSGLGDDMRPSGLLNFNAILNHILKKANNPKQDKTFNIVGQSMCITPKHDKEKTQLTDKLGISESPKKIYDNRSIFDEHSARVYLQALREKSKNQK